MSRSDQLISPKTPGLLTRAELGLHLQVGRNEIPKILARFELSPVERHFPWRSIWRQLLGLAPADEEQELWLQQQLQTIDWVARQTGSAASTVRRKLREGSFDYPAPAVDLGDRQVASRSRRWIPAQILARKRGERVPVFSSVEPFQRVGEELMGNSGGYILSEDQAPNNVFAAMIQHNAQAAR